jgi:trigger factor
MRQAGQARDKVLEELVAGTEIPLPDSVVEAEMQVRTHDAIHAFDHDEQRFGEWLAEQGRSREDFDTEARADAERAVRAQLLLDALAEAEEIAVSDMELTQQIVLQAQRFNISPEEFLQRTQQAGQLGSLYADVRRGKALAQAVGRATVTDASGERVDLSEFLGESDGEQAETVEQPASASAEQPPSAEQPAAAEQAETVEQPASASAEQPPSAEQPAAAEQPETVEQPASASAEQPASAKREQTSPAQA